MSTTFAVDAVDPGPHRFKPTSLADAFARHKIGALEHCRARDAVPLVATKGGNALVRAVRGAWDKHLPLVLTPDVIWLTIAQGLAAHVAADPERHRAFFVRHEGKEVLRVRNDELRPGDPASPWHDVLPVFSAQLAERLGQKRHALIVSDFSTTTPLERIASEIVLMDVVQSYFDYEVDTICGIPSITLEGTVDDWRSIRTRTRHLGELGLERFVDRVTPVLDQLVAAAGGDVDVAHWRGILYESNDMCGPPVYGGWIRWLFPYVVDDAGLPRRENPALDAPDLELPMSMFPSSLARVPFAWNVGLERRPMAFVAGMPTASQHPITGALRPEIAWAVVAAPDGAT